MGGCFRRMRQCKLSLKNHLHTSSVIKCDKPNDQKPIVSTPKSKDKSGHKLNSRESGHKLKTINANKKNLTAELNTKDYASFKSRKFPKVELYNDNRSPQEKLHAKRMLQTFTKEVENKKNVDTPVNKELKTLTVAKPKRKVSKNMKEKLVESAKAVASELGGNVERTEGDILEYLKKLEIKTEERKLKQGVVEAEDDEKEPKPGHFKTDGRKHFRDNRMRFAESRQARFGSKGLEEMERSREAKKYSEPDFDRRMERNEPKISYFLSENRHPGFQRLGLFEAADLKDSGPKLKIWDELEELELKAAAKVPPRNYFEELIQWTKEGKLWHFPIDNDQGNEVEANVDFTEHVFLEDYLEPWCPKRGPLRHFMELVLTGLSKNHYLSVEEKKEHISWYRDYFERKKNLLKDMGVLDSVKTLQESAESESKPENPS